MSYHWTNGAPFGRTSEYPITTLQLIGSAEPPDAGEVDARPAVAADAWLLVRRRGTLRR